MSESSEGHHGGGQLRWQSLFPEDKKVIDGGEFVTDKAGISKGTSNGWVVAFGIRRVIIRLLGMRIVPKEGGFYKCRCGG